MPLHTTCACRTTSTLPLMLVCVCWALLNSGTAQEPTILKVVIVNPAKSEPGKVQQEELRWGARGNGQNKDKKDEDEDEEEKESVRPFGATSNARGYYRLKVENKGSADIAIPEGETLEKLRQRNDFEVLKAPSSWFDYAPAAVDGTPSAPVAAAAAIRRSQFSPANAMKNPGAPNGSQPAAPGPLAAPNPAAPIGEAVPTDPNTPGDAGGDAKATGAPEQDRQREAAKALLEQGHYQETVLNAIRTLVLDAPRSSAQRAAAADESGNKKSEASHTDSLRGFVTEPVQTEGYLDWTQQTAEWSLFYFIDVTQPQSPRLTVKAVVANRTNYDWNSAEVTLQREGQPFRFEVEKCNIPKMSVALVNVTSISRPSFGPDGSTTSKAIGVSDVPLATFQSNLFWNTKTNQIHYAVPLQLFDDTVVPLDDTARIVSARHDQYTLGKTEYFQAGTQKLWLLEIAHQFSPKIQAADDASYVSDVGYDSVKTKIRKSITYSIEAVPKDLKVIIPISPEFQDDEQLPDVDVPQMSAKAEDYKRGFLLLTSEQSPVVLVTDRYVEGTDKNLFSDSLKGLLPKFAYATDDPELDKKLANILSIRKRFDDLKKSEEPLSKKIKQLQEMRFTNLTSQVTGNSDSVLQLVEINLHNTNMKLDEIRNSTRALTDELRLEVYRLEMAWQAFLLRKAHADAQKKSQSASSTATTSRHDAVPSKAPNSITLPTESPFAAAEEVSTQNFVPGAQPSTPTR